MNAVAWGHSGAGGRRGLDGCPAPRVLQGHRCCVCGLTPWRLGAPTLPVLAVAAAPRPDPRPLSAALPRGSSRGCHGGPAKHQALAAQPWLCIASPRCIPGRSLGHGVTPLCRARGWDGVPVRTAVPGSGMSRCIPGIGGWTWPVGQPSVGSPRWAAGAQARARGLGATGVGAPRCLDGQGMPQPCHAAQAGSGAGTWPGPPADLGALVSGGLHFQMAGASVPRSGAACPAALAPPQEWEPAAPHRPPLRSAAGPAPDHMWPVPPGCLGAAPRVVLSPAGPLRGLGGGCPSALPGQALPLGSSASLGSGPAAEAAPVPVPCCSPSSRKQNQGALKGSFKINKK